MQGGIANEITIDRVNRPVSLRTEQAAFLQHDLVSYAVEAV